MNTKKSKIKSKIEAIKNINDKPENVVDNVFDLVRDDLPSIDGIIRRKIDEYQSKNKSKIIAKRDIFNEIIETTEAFLGSNSEKNINQKPYVSNKLKGFAQKSAFNTIRSSKQIIMDTIQSELFSGDGICGSIKKFPVDTLEISPKEFDFMNLLLISPDSTTGKILYEDDVDLGYIKMNKEFYNTFQTLTYDFITNQGETLFTINWDDTRQLYIVSGLTKTEIIGDFILKYFSNIEYPDFENVLKQTMLLTINGDGSEPKNFTIQMDWLDRLLQKIFSICGKPLKEKPLDQNAADQVDEEVDLEYFFDFEDTEGINIDDENNRLQRVLKFTDCNNFELQIDKSHIEDFVYFLSKNKNIDENINEIIDRISIESYESSKGNIPPINFQISLTAKYILNLPRAIISTILSPKIFFPIAVIYKTVKGINDKINVVDIMKNLSKLFYKLIRQLFWRFIQEFWSLVKKELLIFLKNIAMRILKNKLKRYKQILLALMSNLIKLLDTNINSCETIYDIILNTIQKSLSLKTNIPIPGIILSTSDSLPGYSTDGAYMNIVEKLTSRGIPMGDLYGRDNDLNLLIKSIIEGHSEEMDTNSFIKIALKETIIPLTPVGVPITPQIVGVGKIF